MKYMFKEAGRTVMGFMVAGVGAVGVVSSCIITAIGASMALVPAKVNTTPDDKDETEEK